MCPCEYLMSPAFWSAPATTRHGRSRGAQHHGQKFVAELKVIPVNAVVRHQQPSAAALLHRVEGHARR